MASFWCRGKRANHLLDTTDFYVSGSARETGTAAKTAALCKEAKCHTAKNLSFQPVGCRITGDRGRNDFVIFDRAGSQDFGVLRFMLLYSVSTLFCCGNVFLQTAAWRITYENLYFTIQMVAVIIITIIITITNTQTTYLN